MAIATLGIDLARSVFHVHGRGAEGRPVFQKRLSRAALMKFMANLPVCRVGMEVCGGANYWSRTFRAFDAGWGEAGCAQSMDCRETPAPRNEPRLRGGGQ